MSKPMPDTDPLKREPPGETSKVPGTDVGEGGRPAEKPGIDIPAQPGQPTPDRTHPDHPGGPAEPVDPGIKPGL